MQIQIIYINKNILIYVEKNLEKHKSIYVYVIMYRYNEYKQIYPESAVD